MRGAVLAIERAAAHRSRAAGAQHNYWRRIRLADLAAIAQLSRTHLCTTFRRATGLTPFAYLHRYRVERARELLAESTLPIAAVAVAVGVPDPYYFSRAFRRSEGLSPAAYRRAHHGAGGP